MDNLLTEMDLGIMNKEQNVFMEVGKNKNTISG
jgi:hypothetical protein